MATCSLLLVLRRSIECTYTYVSIISIQNYAAACASKGSALSSSLYFLVPLSVSGPIGPFGPLAGLWRVLEIVQTHPRSTI